MTARAPLRLSVALSAAFFGLVGNVRADEFTLTVTHQELASRLGTVREVVSRNLARFRAEGLIQILGHQVRLLDRTGLEREAEPE